MSLTLFINKSDSHCECSFGGVDPHALECPHCGGTWDTLSSDYSQMAKLLIPIRPDLEPHFPWDDFFKTEEGQAALDKLRNEINIDPQV